MGWAVLAWEENEGKEKKREKIRRKRGRRRREKRGKKRVLVGLGFGRFWF